MEDFSGLVSAIAEQTRYADRAIVAIFGPSASGKSTLSSSIAPMLSPPAAIMDVNAFQFDHEIISQMEHKIRRGSPEAFDVRGLELALKRIRAREESVVVPTYDSSLDLSRGAAGKIIAMQKFVIVEGSYLGLQRGPWASLHQYFDITIAVDVDPLELRRRLVRRWTDKGWTPEGVAQWLATSHLRNAQIVAEGSRKPDLIWHSPNNTYSDDEIAELDRAWDERIVKPSPES